jgi:hypothetical protein
MDGAGGLAPGIHSLRLDFHDAQGGPVIEGSPHLFNKEGDPEESAGPFHDDRYDGEDLQEVCAVKRTGQTLNLEPSTLKR